MIKWNYDKLDQMNQYDNECSNIKLDYKVLADKIEEIVPMLKKNGEIIPLEFEDLNVACSGNLFDNIDTPEISDEIKEKINQKERERKIMSLKHFSRDISHEEWYGFLDQEVIDFVEKYPQFSNIMKLK